MWPLHINSTAPTLTESRWHIRSRPATAAHTRLGEQRGLDTLSRTGSDGGSPLIPARDNSNTTANGRESIMVPGPRHEAHAAFSQVQAQSPVRADHDAQAGGHDLERLGPVLEVSRHVNIDFFALGRDRDSSVLAMRALAMAWVSSHGRQYPQLTCMASPGPRILV